MSLALSIYKRPYAEIDLLRMALDSRITFTRASAQTYFDASSLIASAANDVCPLRYDASTGLVAGRAVWEARTNLLVNSGFGTGAFSGTNSGCTIGTVSWLNHFTNAVTFGDNSLLRYAYNTTFTSLANVTYALSVFVKMDDGGAPIPGGATSAFDFSLVMAGQVVTAQTVQHVGGGIYRVLGARTHTANSSPNGVVKYNSNSARTFKVTGYQLEAAPFASPYIPTTSASVTRAVDTATITNLASLNFNASAGTLYATVTAPASTVNAATLFSVNDNTANEVLRIHMEAGGVLKAQVIDGGVTQADLTLATLTAGQAVRVAMAYAANDIRACLNGGSVQSDASATLPTVDRMMIGRSVAGESWNANMRAMRVYRRALADSELQALTT